MKATADNENSSTQIGLLTLVSIIIAAFGAIFGTLAATFSVLENGEISWITLTASIVCLIVAGSVFIVERSQS